MAIDTTTLIWLIPLPPVLAFFAIVLFTHRDRELSHSIAIGSVLVSWLGSMIVFLRALAMDPHDLGSHPFEAAVQWLPIGSGSFDIGVRIDPLSAITLFFVAWTILMIFIYSVGYHNFGQPEGDHDQKGLPPHGATVTDEHGHKHTVLSVEPMYSRFFAFLSLFAFGMYVLVVSNNLLTLFVGWEIMGLCSYLLIGFWYGKVSARNAMIKAFITTRIGDVFMLLGLAFLYSKAGSLSYSVIFSEETLKMLGESTAFFGLNTAAAIGILLFIGAVGKSAQFPLHVWLPDAMEGPTPVSAMIHAATMVSAGVYLVIRIFPILSAAGHGHGEPNTALLVVSLIGTFTAIFAATIAVAQNDIKKVLAYSTISQLGFMIAALGIGAYIAAAFHLVTHAFFKALLFLGSGSVIHGMEHGVLHTGNHKVDPQDMMNMGGLRKKMPITFWTFLIGGLALSGFPFVTAGFWSKDEILADAWYHHHYLVFATLAIAALMTAFYTMRQITLTFFGEPRTKEAEHAHETPLTMTIPLMILSVFAIGAGWVGMPEWLTGGAIPNWFHDFVGSTLAEHPKAPPFNIVPLATSLVVALGGLWLGYQTYKSYKAGQVDPMKKLLGGLHPVLENKYGFDEFYDKTFVAFARWISETFTFKWMDQGAIDGFLHGISRVALTIGSTLLNYFENPVVTGVVDWFSNGFKSVGQNLRVVQTGRIQQYMLVALVNILAIGLVLYYLLGL